MESYRFRGFGINEGFGVSVLTSMDVATISLLCCCKLYCVLLILCCAQCRAREANFARNDFGVVSLEFDLVEL